MTQSAQPRESTIVAAVMRALKSVPDLVVRKR
jgi:hypothetical protein